MEHWDGEVRPTKPPMTTITNEPTVLSKDWIMYPVKQVAAGNNHCCYLTSDGDVYMNGMYVDSDSGIFRLVPTSSNMSPEGSYPQTVLVPLPGKSVDIYSGQSANNTYATGWKMGVSSRGGFGNCGELARTSTMDSPLRQDGGTLDTGRRNYLNDGGPQYNETVLMRFLTPSVVPMQNCRSFECGMWIAHVLVVARETANGVGFVYSSGLNIYGQLGYGHAATMTGLPLTTIDDDDDIHN